MKSSTKILVVVLAVLLLVACLASCDFGKDDVTTTEPAVTTTEPPVTTTKAAPVAITGIRFESKEVDYSGSEKGLIATPHSALNTEYAYYAGEEVDEAKKLEGKPTNAGTYTVVATFSFKDASSAEQYILPTPMTATLTIKPMTLSATVNNVTGYYYSGCEYEIALPKVPEGITASGKLMQTADEEGPLATPVEVTTGKATDIGTYTFTVSFTDTTGNYAKESLADKTATITVKQCPQQILKYTPSVDGELDEAYKQSAHFRTTTNTAANQEEYVILTKIFNMSTKSDFDLTADFWFLWDEDWVYLFADVKDSTNNARIDEYVLKPDPWVNDAFEVYYFFGGYEKPAFIGGTPYPSWSGLTTDAKGRGSQTTTADENAAKISAVPAQASLYFNEIKCAVTYDEKYNNGDGIEYKIELAFPTKQETNVNANGKDTEGNGIFKKEIVDGEGNTKKVSAGEFAFVCFQLDDLFLPVGAEYPVDAQGAMDKDAWDAQVYPTSMMCYGNKSVAASIAAQFSSDAPILE